MAVDREDRIRAVDYLPLQDYVQTSDLTGSGMKCPSSEKGAG